MVWKADLSTIRAAKPSHGHIDSVHRKREGHRHHVGDLGDVLGGHRNVESILNWGDNGGLGLREGSCFLPLHPKIVKPTSMWKWYWAPILNRPCTTLSADAMAASTSPYSQAAGSMGAMLRGSSIPFSMSTTTGPRLWYSTCT